MILVETSAFISRARGHVTPGARLIGDLDRDDLHYCISSVCVQEVLQGARGDKEWRDLQQHLLAHEILLPSDPVANAVEAARIYRDARRRGITIGANDCRVAALALEYGALLVHDDRGFERVKEVCPGLRTLHGPDDAY